MKEIDFSKLIKKNIRALRPYEAKDVPCKVKLDANESPYSPLQESFSEKLNQVNLNRYPDPDARELKKAIAKNFRVSYEEILLGNGSDELIYYLITAFGGNVLYPAPTFSMYGIISQSLGERHMGIPLDRDFDLHTEKMLSAIKKYKPKILFLSSPNNPTGNCFSTERILKIVESSKGIVLIDEAYQPFSGKKSFLPMLKDYRNLAILRTLSKIGFAALRIGFLIAHRDLIREVNKVRLPFNLNSVSQAMAMEALKNKKIVEHQIKNIASERRRLFKELNTMAGIKPYPSEANFILFKLSDAMAVFQKLIEKGVLIRNMDGVIKNSLRVTIGTPEENTFFINTLREVISEN